MSHPSSVTLALGIQGVVGLYHAFPSPRPRAPTLAGGGRAPPGGSGGSDGAARLLVGLGAQGRWCPRAVLASAPIGSGVLTFAGFVLLTWRRVEYTDPQR